MGLYIYSEKEEKLQNAALEKHSLKKKSGCLIHCYELPSLPCEMKRERKAIKQ
jgi:hypothetical protein